MGFSASFRNVRQRPRRLLPIWEFGVSFVFSAFNGCCPRRCSGRSTWAGASDGMSLRRLRTARTARALIRHPWSATRKRPLRTCWAGGKSACARGGGVVRAPQRRGECGSRKGALATGQSKKASLSTSEGSPPGPHSGPEEFVVQKQSPHPPNDTPPCQRYIREVCTKGGGGSTWKVAEQNPGRAAVNLLMCHEHHVETFSGAKGQSRGPKCPHYCEWLEVSMAGTSSSVLPTTI